VIADALGVAPSRVTITRGHGARDKLVAVEDVAAEELVGRWLGLRVR
jgi:uncharacterized protein YggU (UPF0235/DUF167 family)